MAKKEPSARKIIAQNRKARHNYEIVDTFEAGIVLLGSEVKSLRVGKASIVESYATEENEEIYLINSYISPYPQATQQHAERRKRKLLLHKREVKKLIGLLKTKGMTLVPLQMYFNERNKVKVELAVGKGKKLHDKRETEKRRDWDREKQRLLKEK